MTAPDTALVLVVEDDPGIATLEQRRLERAGYPVALAKLRHMMLPLAGHFGWQGMRAVQRLAGHIPAVVSATATAQRGGASRDEV